MSPYGQHERRSGARASVALELHLARKVGQPVTARTLDIGTGGARVTCERPLRIDEELHFDADLPAVGRRLDGVARVLRQARHNEYALRFEHVAPAMLADLQSFLAATERAPAV